MVCVLGKKQLCDMDAEVARTQELLVGLISGGPVLTEKLLQKPPLRFLHDVFVAVAREHGLMRGLFDADEVAWNETIANDKEAKAFFIAKVKSILVKSIYIFKAGNYS